MTRSMERPLFLRMMTDTPYLRVHADLLMPEPYDDPDGLARPYVVTIDKSKLDSFVYTEELVGKILKSVREAHFVHYRYLPGLGFYGTGLIHLIGGLAKSATSILRQLIDAGTLSNLPAGLQS